MPSTHAPPLGRAKVPNPAVHRRDGRCQPTWLIPELLGWEPRLQPRLLDPTAPHHPPTPRPHKCPCLSMGVNIRLAAGQGAAGAQRLREQEREWGCGFSQHSILSPLALGSLGEGPPRSLQGHLHCYLEPTRRGYPPTFATFLPPPFSVAPRLPMFFSGYHSPALLVSISVSQSLFPFCHILSRSLRSFSLSFWVCLSCFRALCLCAPFSGSPVPLLPPQPALWPAVGTGPSKRKPHPSRSARLGCATGYSTSRPVPPSLGPPRTASWLQRGALGAVRTLGSPTRARAQGPPLRRALQPPSLCAAFNGRLSARLPRKLFSRTSVTGGVPIVPWD